MFPQVSGRLYFPTITTSAFLRSVDVCICVFPTSPETGSTCLSFSSYLLAVTESKPSPEFPFENHSKEPGQLFKDDSCLRGVNWLKFFQGSFEKIQQARQIEEGWQGGGGEGRRSQER